MVEVQTTPLPDSNHPLSILKMPILMVAAKEVVVDLLLILSLCKCLRMPNLLILHFKDSEEILGDLKIYSNNDIIWIYILMKNHNETMNKFNDNTLF